MAILGSSDNQTQQLNNVIASLENVNASINSVYKVQAQLLSLMQGSSTLDQKAFASIKDTMDRQTAAINRYFSQNFGGRNTSDIASAQVSSTSRLISSQNRTNDEAINAEVAEVAKAIKESTQKLVEASKNATTSNETVLKLIGVMEKQTTNMEAIGKIVKDIKEGKISTAEEFFKRSGTTVDKDKEQQLSPIITKMLEDVKNIQSGDQKTDVDEREKQSDLDKLEEDSNQAIIQIRDMMIEDQNEKKKKELSYKKDKTKNKKTESEKSEKNEGGKFSASTAANMTLGLASIALTAKALADSMKNARDEQKKFEHGTKGLKKDLENSQYTDDSKLEAGEIEAIEAVKNAGGDDITTKYAVKATKGVFGSKRFNMNAFRGTNEALYDIYKMADPRYRAMMWQLYHGSLTSTLKDYDEYNIDKASLALERFNKSFRNNPYAQAGIAANVAQYGISAANMSGTDLLIAAGTSIINVGQYLSKYGKLWHGYSLARQDDAQIQNDTYVKDEIERIGKDLTLLESNAPQNNQIARIIIETIKVIYKIYIATINDTDKNYSAILKRNVSVTPVSTGGMDYSSFGSAGDVMMLRDADTYVSDSARGYVRSANYKIKLRASIDKLVGKYVAEASKCNYIDECIEISRKYIKECAEICKKASDELVKEIKDYVSTDSTYGSNYAKNAAVSAYRKNLDKNIEAAVTSATKTIDSVSTNAKNIIDSAASNGTFFNMSGSNYVYDKNSGNMFMVTERGFAPISDESINFARRDVHLGRLPSANGGNSRNDHNTTINNNGNTTFVNSYGFGKPGTLNANNLVPYIKSPGE